MMTALITGVAGQDGTLLARRLLAQGRRVIGTVRPGSTMARAPYLDGVEIEFHDVTDTEGFGRLLTQHRPDEVYNLAGFTSVGASWNAPEAAMAANFHAVEGMLDALLRMRDETGSAPRFFQASSSAVYGPDSVRPVDEDTPHDPRSPYGESKSLAHRSTQRARESEGLHASVGILFNHESPLRGAGFVTGKITRAAAEIAAGVRSTVALGELNVSRDWGWADDYVAAMPAILAKSEPGDYVLATGELRSLRDLLECAFADACIDDPWAHVEQDPALLRPADGPGLRGDASRAERDLGWTRSVDFDEMVAQMVAVDTVRVRTGIEENVAYAPVSRSDGHDEE